MTEERRYCLDCYRAVWTALFTRPTSVQYNVSIYEYYCQKFVSDQGPGPCEERRMLRCLLLLHLDGDTNCSLEIAIIMVFLLSWITSLLYALFNFFGLATPPPYDAIVVGYVNCFSEGLSDLSWWTCCMCKSNSLAHICVQSSITFSSERGT